MKQTCRSLIQLCLFFLIVCACSVSVVQCAADTGWFWQVTDFHYDANYSIHGNPSAMCHLSNGSNYTNGIYGNYLCDAPWKLVESAISEMKFRNATPDFILWTGDSVPHVKDSELSLTKVYENIRRVSDQLREVFPNISIYPVLGNHDPFPFNQMSPTAVQYYQGILNSSHWDKMLGDKEQSDFVKGGYYSSMTDSGLRILGLNTNLYYGMDNLTALIWDPADQFHWMRNQLLDAKHNKQKVYIVSHVPPGVFERMANMTWFYSEHNERYLRIMHEFSNTIAAQIYGHGHTDSFRILYSSSGTPLNSVFLSPAVTPWKSTLPGVGANNPSLRLYKYDRFTGGIVDYIQYFVNLTAANAESRTDWQVEYQATKEYNISDLSPQSLHNLLESFQDHANGYWRKYLVYNSVGYDMDPVCDKSCVQAQMCAIQKLNFREYNFCIKDKHPTTETPTTTQKLHHHKNIPTYMYYVLGSLAVVVVVMFFVIMLLCISRRRHIAPYRRFSTSLNA